MVYTLVPPLACPAGCHCLPCLPQMNLNLLCNKNCCRFSTVNVSIRQGVALLPLSLSPFVCSTQDCLVTAPLHMRCQLVKSYVSQARKNWKHYSHSHFLLFCPSLSLSPPFPSQSPFGSCHSAVKRLLILMRCVCAEGGEEVKGLTAFRTAQRFRPGLPHPIWFARGVKGGMSNYSTGIFYLT